MTHRLPGGNVLFVSIAFPPKSDPEALQSARYFKYLLREGLDIDVVTSADPTLWMPVDESLRPMGRGVRQRIEVPIFEPRALSVGVLKLAPGLAWTPDTRQSFFWRWRQVVRNLRHRPDVIYSRSFPLSSTLMGLRLHRHYGVPWVLHLSDPWWGSPILQFRGLSDRYHQRTERACFSEATAITLASPRMVDLYARRYPHWRHKFFPMPNVYDPEDVAPAGRPDPRTGPVRLVYTGSLQGSRTTAPLLRALALLAARAPHVLKGLQVELAGAMDAAERDTLRGAPPCVRQLGHLPLLEAVQLQRSADVLLVIDSPLKPEDSVFFPSKLLDYMAARKPMVALTSAGSMTREVLEAVAGGCFEHHEHEALASHLETLVARRSQGAPLYDRAAEPDPRFSAAANAGRLADLLRTARPRPTSFTPPAAPAEGS